mgnify:CR=1 FL=1
MWDVGTTPAWLDTGSAGGVNADVDDDAPDRARFGRWRTAPPAALALIAVAVVAVGFTAFSVFSGVGEADTPRVAFPSTAGRAVSSAPESSAPPTELVVSVVGLVHRPGLVRLPPQSRVADALNTAGGPRPGADVTSINQAQLLHDGDQILIGFADPATGPRIRSAVVGSNGRSPTGSPGGQLDSPPKPGTGGAGGAGKVNLNTADESALDALPGVGPVTAKAIIAWRTQHGKFTSVDQLGEVDGIGPARLAKLRELVVV